MSPIKLGEEIPTKIFRAGLISLTVRGAGVTLGFVVHAILAKTLGASNYGLYAIAIGWCLILTTLAEAGVSNALLKFGAVFYAQRQFTQLYALLRFAAKLLAWSICLVSLFLLLVSLVNIEILGITSTRDVLLLVVLIGSLAIVSSLSAFFRAAHSIFASQIYEQVLRPTFLILAMAIFMSIGKSIELSEALALTALCAFLALVAMQLKFRELLPGLSVTKVAPAQNQEWLSYVWPMIFIAVVYKLLTQSTVILLGWLSSSTESGQYALAMRLASFVPFGLVALNSIAAPMIAAAYKNKDTPSLRRIAKTTSRLATLFAVLLALAFFSWGDWLLLQFGADFEKAYPSLLILSVGGVINAGTGTVGYFMTMTGHHNNSLSVMFVSLLISLILSFALIPRFGSIGGAAASAIAISVMSIVQHAFVYRRLGIDTSIFGLLPSSTRDTKD